MLWSIKLFLYNHHTSFIFICMHSKSLVYNFSNGNGNVSIISYWKLRHSFLIHQSSTYNNIHLVIDSIHSKLSMRTKLSQIISIYFTLFPVYVYCCSRVSYHKSNVMQTKKHSAFNQKTLKHANIVYSNAF